MTTPPSLAPTQRRALDALLDAARPGRVVLLIGNVGNGKTSVLENARATLGGVRIGAAELQVAAAKVDPLAIENAFYDLVTAALDDNSTVFVDDLHLIAQVVDGCHAYPRGGYIALALSALSARAAATQSTIIISTAAYTNSLFLFGSRVNIADLDAVDYRSVAASYLAADQIDRLDFAKVYRFARRMTARQLRSACQTIRPSLESTSGDATDILIEYLRSAQLVSNVDLGEVQTVSLADLKGVDDVIRALEANVIMPLEHSELASELSLRPKRGVLLVGPPGTGKTTIGRALAHRLRGKFFLIDGTVIAGTPHFYGQLHHVFEAAMRNAPAVVFIDDSDVIFEGQDPGLYRYLLTMLDGLESESAGGVCLMLTAMDIGSLPPALVRSGRVELWLETSLPDDDARRAILSDLCAQLPRSMGTIDLDRLAASTEGLSGADLKRVVEDGKLLYAFDRARERTIRNANDYFVDALETIRANKIRYAQAEAAARARNPSRPPQFNVGFPGMMGMRGEFVESHVVTMFNDEMAG